MDKKINKLRQKEFKKNPKLKEIYDAELTKYNNPTFLGQGSFADVFTLPNNRILRIELGYQHVTAGRTKVETMLTLMKLTALNKLACPITPTIYDSYLIHINSNTWITTTIMEKLQVLKWKEWKKVFKSEQELASAVFQSIHTLIQFDIYHRDINFGNVVLTLQGIRFVDIDDVCTDIPKLIYNCDDVTGTPGFVGPEWNKLKRFRDKPIKERHQWFKHQMYYAAGKLIYGIITDGDVEKVNLDLIPDPIVRQWVQNAIHTTPSLRTIHLGDTCCIGSKTTTPAAAAAGCQNVAAVAKEAKAEIIANLSALQQAVEQAEGPAVGPAVGPAEEGSLQIKIKVPKGRKIVVRKKKSVVVKKKKSVVVKKKKVTKKKSVVPVPRSLSIKKHCHGKTQSGEPCQRKLTEKRCCKTHEAQPSCKI